MASSRVRAAAGKVRPATWRRSSKKDLRIDRRHVCRRRCGISRCWPRRVERMCRSVDALLTPATVTAAPSMATTGDPRFNSPWSYAGVPTVSLPCSLLGQGLPCAIQLIAEASADARLLHVADWCERRLGFDCEPPILGGQRMSVSGTCKHATKAPWAFHSRVLLIWLFLLSRRADEPLLVGMAREGDHAVADAAGVAGRLSAKSPRPPALTIRSWPGPWCSSTATKRWPWCRST